MNEPIQNSENHENSEQETTVQVALPEGLVASDYVLVNKSHLAALEKELDRVYHPTKRGITKKAFDRKKAKALRRIQKASRQQNRGKK